MNTHTSPGRKLASLLLPLFLTIHSLAQHTDSTRSEKHFSGSIQLTQNGIALVPTFSLGKPAAIFLLTVGGKRFSVEPDFRFALSGKPWTMLLWFRYRPQHTGRLNLTFGVHPALNFRTQTDLVNNEAIEHLVARPFLATEVSPQVNLNKNLQLGSYYLFSRGFDKQVAKYNHFLAIQGSLHGLSLPGKLALRVNPQVYFLKQDERQGYFFSSQFSLSQKKIPFSLTTLINKRISGNIAGAKDFVWNLTLAYSFYQAYHRK